MTWIIYKSNTGKHALMLCSLKEVYTDRQGDVHTCTANFRPRHVTKKNRTYRIKSPEVIRIGVQKIFVFIPV